MEKRFVVTQEKQQAVEQNRQHNPNLKRRWRQLSIDLWIWEVGSLLLSTCCVGAIIVILLEYDNKPLPTWNYGLTINGVISILAVVAKASMILPIAEAISQLKWHWYWGRQRPIMDFQVFDAASRGPWGCVQMLCRPKQISLATIGAFLTLATLFMEPSLQLIPTYVPRLVASGGASVPRSFFYKDRFSGLVVDSTHHSETDQVWTLGTRTKHSLYNSMFGSAAGEKQQAVPACSTGNCTFPNFSTLGVCSDCTNVTAYLTLNTDNDAAEWLLPNGASTDSGTLAWAWIGERMMAYQPVVNQTIADFFYLDQRNLPKGGFSHPQAFECVMWMCVKTFSASMNLNVYNEEVISIWPGTNETIPEFPTLPTDNLVQGNFTFRSPNSTVEYTVDMPTVSLLKEWLWLLWQSFSYSPGGDEGDVDSDVGQAFYQAQELGKTGQQYSANTSAQLSGPGPVLAQVADGMTVTIRSIAGPKSSVAGSAMDTQIFVKARWIWSGLPIALIFLSFVFMISTLTISLRRGVPVWKSSSLAVLVHGLDEDTRDQVAAAKLDAMEDNAKAQTMIISLKRST